MLQTNYGYSGDCSCCSGYCWSDPGDGCHPCYYGTYDDGSGNNDNSNYCTNQDHGISCSFGTSVTCEICPGICPAGTYNGNLGSTSSNDCLDCPSGKFSGSQSASCTDCSPGYFQPNSGQGSCIQCPGGEFQSANGQSGCQSCNAGTFSNSGQSTCQSCSPGTYSISGQSTCQSCSPGTYSGSGAGSCAFCSAGTYSSSPGQSYCQPCTAGTYSNGAGANACVPCSAGDYSSSGQSTCQPCNAGTYSGADAASCISCSAGTYADSGQSSCQSCPAGTYSLSGQSVCSLCTPGSYSGIQAGSCSPCSAGFFSNSSGSSFCSPCKPGYYSGFGADGCFPCSAGTYNNFTASSTCSVCPAGTFSESNSTICIDCSVGYYSNKGSPACTACAPGSFVNSTGSATCQLCREGSFISVSGFTSCQPCSSGTFSNITGASNCMYCPINMYTSTEGTVNCSACALGSFTNAVGSTICTSPSCQLSYGSGHQSVAVTYTLVILPFMAVAIIIQLTRKKSDLIIRFNLLSVCLQLLGAGADFTSDILYMFFLGNGFYVPKSSFTLTMTIILVVARFFHPVSTFFLLDSILFGSLTSKRLINVDYTKTVDVPHMSKYKKEYALLFILTLIETPLVTLLPWIKTDFSDISGGYPDKVSFHICCWSKISQATISVVVQVAVFCELYQNVNLHVPSCQYSLIVTLLTTTIPLALSIIEQFFQGKNIHNFFLKSKLMTGASESTDLYQESSPRTSRIEEYTGYIYYII